MGDSNLRADVAGALHVLGSRQDVIQDTHGNVSAFDGEVMFIKPSGMEYSKIKQADVCALTKHGIQHKWNPELEGFKNRKPSVDTPHHLAIYKRHKRIKAICHTHSPYATAYAYNLRPIRCLGTEQADFFGGDVVCLPYVDLNSWGEFTAKWLHQGDRNAILLGRHGVLTFGETPLEAVKYAAALENVARKNFLAESLFSHDKRFELSQLNSHEIKKWYDRYNNEYGQ